MNRTHAETLLDDLVENADHAMLEACHALGLTEEQISDVRISAHEQALAWRSIPMMTLNRRQAVEGPSAAQFRRELAEAFGKLTSGIEEPIEAQISDHEQRLRDIEACLNRHFPAPAEEV